MPVVSGPPLPSAMSNQPMGRTTPDSTRRTNNLPSGRTTSDLLFFSNQPLGRSPSADMYRGPNISIGARPQSAEPSRTPSSRVLLHQNSAPDFGSSSSIQRPSELGRSITPPGRILEDKERRHRRKRRATSDSESGRRSSRMDRSDSRSVRSVRSSGTKTSIAKDSLPTNFRSAIAEYAPPLPPALLRKLEIREVHGLGKVSTLYLLICLFFSCISNPSTYIQFSLDS